MKKLHVLFSVLVFSVLLVSCGQRNSSSSSDNISVSETNDVEVQGNDILSSSDNTTESETTEVLITVPDNVSEVIISPRSVKDMTFKYTDASKIDAIASYIRDLGILTKCGGNPGLSTGTSSTRMDYEIILNAADGNTEVYYLLASNFFKQGKEGEWCEIAYVTGEAFRDVLHENEPDVPAKIPLFVDVPITIPENVTGVTVECSSCGNSETHQYTDPEKIDAIVSYISDLGTLKTSEVQNTSWCGGISYIITFYSADGTSEVFYDRGFFFKQGKYGQWCDVKLGHDNRLKELLEKYESDVTEEVSEEE